MEKFNGVDCIIENKVNFKTEVSLIGVRSKNGNTLFYPLIENFHENGILKMSIVPFNDPNYDC